MNNAVQSLHIGNDHICGDGVIFTFYGQNTVVERADCQEKATRNPPLLAVLQSQTCRILDHFGKRVGKGCRKAPMGTVLSALTRSLLQGNGHLKRRCGRICCSWTARKRSKTMALLRWMTGLALLWRVRDRRVFRRRHRPLQRPKFRREALLHRQRKAFGAVWLLSGPLRRRL